MFLLVVVNINVILMFVIHNLNYLVIGEFRGGIEMIWYSKRITEKFLDKTYTLCATPLVSVVWILICELCDFVKQEVVPLRSKCEPL